jgi:hypothetical protein
MTKKIEDGGPAFPLTIVHESDGRTGAPVKCDVFTGLSHRDWFAGQALSGLVQMHNGIAVDPTATARAAQQYADALVAALKAER